MRHKGIGFVAAAALIAAPVLAEKAYIPVSDGAVGLGGTHRTEISVSNGQSAGESRFSVRLGGAEGAGRAAAQDVVLKGGESRQLSGLAGNGLAELDLPKGVSADAMLIVERPGHAAARVWIPVLSGQDTLSPGSHAMLLGAALAGDFHKTSVGVINLSTKPMQCMASYADGHGSDRFAPVTFTVAPRAERRTGDTFGGAKKGVDVDSLSGVRCDRSFYAYALAENRSTGEIKFVYPSKEITLVATQSSTVTAEASKVFTIPGTFLVAGIGHWSFHYNMPFGASTTYRKVALDVDVTVGQWDPKKPSGIHLLWWFQKGPKWGTDLMQYLNALKGNSQKFRYNYWPSLGTQGGPGVKTGGAYHIHGYWDGVQKKNGYTITQGGNAFQSKSLGLTKASFTSAATFIEFAHPNDGPDGPESRSPGWTWSNFRAEFTP